MIRRLVDFALKSRFLVLGSRVMLFVWGAISFHNLPVDAYPDVANNYVNIITQWPGHSAEDIEKQVTVPSEIADGRHSRHEEPALLHSGRHLQHHDELQRRLQQRLESSSTSSNA